MCNFNKVLFFLENVCPGCLHLHGEEVRIVHPFYYSNGKKKISEKYHCSKCGNNFSSTSFNKLDKGEKERIDKARMLFEETKRINLNNSSLEVFCYVVVQKNQIKKIKLNTLDPVHILNDTYFERKPTHFLQTQHESSLVIIKNPGGLPLVEVFDPKSNYEEVYVPWELINFDTP